MKGRKSLLLTMLMSILWSGCAIITKPAINNESITETPVSPTSITEEPTSLAPATINIEPTALSPSTVINTTETIQVCPKSDIQIPPSDSFGIPGTIVFQKGSLPGLYTVGGGPLIYSQLPVSDKQENFAFGFSSNGEWFAFSPLEFSPTNEIIFESPKIVLLSAAGARIEHTLSVESFSDELQVEHRLQGFSGYSDWVNNTTIYTTLYSINPNPNSTGQIAHLPKVFDPFAGVWREELLKDLPEDARMYAKGISPDMTRMLYMDGGGLFLKDLEQGVDIWHDKDLFAGFGALMFWSPDSETVAYANLFDLPNNRTVVLISRNGIAKTIMGSSLSLSGLYVMDLRWSPDGHYLALLVAEDQQLSVFIYDFAAEKYISQCPIAKYTDRSPKLIWSPDNKYLAYVALDYPLIIMDIQSGEIVQLADDARAVGWSDKFPAVWP